MNTTAYIIYLFLTYLITVHVGIRFYRYGRIYILHLFDGDHSLTNFINRILLTGYYLLNLGYATLMLRQWETMSTWSAVALSITIMIGKILVILAIIHFVNMAVIFFLSLRKPTFLHNKNLSS